MIIEVTQCDIEYGIPRLCSKCPIARAVWHDLKIELDVGAHVEVTERAIRVRTYDQAPTLRYHAPRSVVRFIKKFDNHKPVKPFKFRLVRIDREGNKLAK